MQVVSNLIANSMHAMAAGGALTLRLHAATVRDRPSAVLEIQDTGCGIAPDNLQRIFEPFFTTRGTIGTGIGLWVAKQFVESHGGTIEVQSSTGPEDHGTTMTICLPGDEPAPLVQ